MEMKLPGCLLEAEKDLSSLCIFFPEIFFFFFHVTAKLFHSALSGVPCFTESTLYGAASAHLIQIIHIQSTGIEFMLSVQTMNME